MRNESRSGRAHFIVASLVVCVCLIPQAVSAQLAGFNIKGDQGLKSGSQAPPGTYFGAPLNWYKTDTIKNEDGKALSTTGDVTLFLGGPLVNVVTSKKLFGANYGFLAAFPLVNTRIELPRFDEDAAAAFTDIYVQPINLGWHLPLADVIAGYGMFLPTGRYAAGANDNTGLGMWGHEVFIGSTVFFDERRAWHAATNSAFEFHSNKEDSEAHVGPLLTLEGGVGRDFLKGAVSTGLAYYAQWKLGNDTLTGIPSLLVRGKNRVGALGPEITVPVATKSTVYGFVTVRYQWEVGARTTTEGNVLHVFAIVPLRPIKVNP